MAAATKVAAKVPINTLMAAWQEQAVPVRGTPGHWQGVGGSLEVSHGPPCNRPGEVVGLGSVCVWELGVGSWDGKGGQEGRLRSVPWARGLQVGNGWREGRGVAC